MPDLDSIVRVNVATQGPPAAGLTASEKSDILADILALEADVADLLADLPAAESDIVTLQADMSDTRQGWISLPIDGGGSVIGTGVRLRVLLPFDATITPDPVDGHVWRVGLDQTGSISLDLWMGLHGSYPPTSANRISGTVGTNNPRVTTSVASQSSSLTNWTSGLVGGRWLFVNVSSVTTATYATLGLYLVRT
jgi:hypothetical protein